MTKLTWDDSGERLYETGTDRGVLYLPSAPGVYNDGVAWNGLISVEELFDADESEPMYFDGIKYLDRYNIGDYAANLTAFTYPDEFLDFEGMKSLGSGLYVDDQPTKVFGLSYRTRIGNDLLAHDYAYKIHLLYNLTANLDDLIYENGENPSEPLNFTWEVSSVPENAPGYRPTAHIIFDSRFLDAAMLAGLEDIIYGVDSVNPRLPSLVEFIGIVTGWNPKLIIPQLVTGLADLVDGYGDLTLIKVPGFYTALPDTRLVKTTTDGVYRLV